MAEVLVINPNSSKAVTRSMEGCLGVFDGNGHRIRCMELENAPPGIETDDHVSEVIPLLLDAAVDARADAIVISCFSDPGIGRVRAATPLPVIGIAEAAYLAALGLGDRFGIVSLGPSSIVRHRRYLEALKLEHRLAGDRSLDMTIVELVATNVVQRVARIGAALRDEDGADVIILGCAGLGAYRAALQAELGLPIVDPVQAGVALACTHAELGYLGRGK
ncbi:aspartate/glutamate racemase family protein [Microvirga sp. BT689]|uniref:aspartate/glutamate racemase family protein n=1 Tax=Microvirga arvi TaxID=2778731 RepID=UPI00194FCB16|nr:aspartate/glutamate racemase family protein [Microvirga arvi]MBM6581313.1 aspartate/glutamate racemase family protein [Microvirga arvi]